MKSMWAVLSLCAVLMVSCATMVTEDGKPTGAAMSLAYDLGFAAAALSPGYRMELQLACTVFDAINEDKQQQMIDLVKEVWTKANEQQAVAVCLMANNLIGLTGLADRPRDPQYVVDLMGMFCSGVGIVD